MALDRAFKVACLAFLAICVARPSYGQEEVFDVTKYGAVADGETDNSKAFLDAWKAACGCSSDTSFVIPTGTFMVGPITFGGPCHSNLAPNVKIQGTLRAPSLDHIPTIGWIEFNSLHNLAVGGGGTLDGQGGKAWNTKSSNHKSKNLPTSLRFTNVNNATVSDLNLIDSKGFHVNFHGSANVKVHHLNISAPADSPNTDGIHIAATDHINITSTTIGTGDDCISIGPGATSVSIVDVTCGPGHGISVGSLGKYQNEKNVMGVTVRNCTVSSTQNGVRIKTWPGSPPSEASNFIFEDIVMDNVANPIIIDQEYCPMHHCTDEPSRVKIHDVTFKQIRGTSNTPVAVTLVCSKSMPCENVQLIDINLDYVESGAKEITSSCSNVQGTTSGTQNPTPCV